MKEWITDTALSFWNDFIYYVTLQFVDPFWWLLAVVIVATVAITGIMGLIGFYFGMPSWLRKIGGFIVFGMIAALTFFRIGENAARKHDAKRKPAAPKQSEPKPWVNPFNW